ncbi:actin-binding ADF family protein [Streptomyces litmocidini]|uniref:Actin-binding ADF family protein n=1 Tax=Streptomyces litmocidini TaxID=67318 RepID=A0ABW7TZU4_9ACTN
MRESNVTVSTTAISTAAVEAYQDLKLKRSFRYIIFTLSEDFSEVVVEKTSASGGYNDFLEDLPEDECRFAVYDLEFEVEDGGKRNRIVFFSWAPDDAKLKQKMLFANSRDDLKRTLTGVGLEISGTDPGEVSYEAVVDKASRGN